MADPCRGRFHLGRSSSPFPPLARPAIRSLAFSTAGEFLKTKTTNQASLRYSGIKTDRRKWRRLRIPAGSWLSPWLIRPTFSARSLQVCHVYFCCHTLTTLLHSFLCFMHTHQSSNDCRHQFPIAPSFLTSYPLPKHFLCPSISAPYPIPTIYPRALHPPFIPLLFQSHNMTQRTD